jgi:hypothetical protein
MRRLAIAVLLMIALLAISWQTPVQSCSMTMPAAAAMKCGGCCATMKSCVLPQQSPLQQTAPAPATQQSIVMIAPVLSELLLAVISAPDVSRQATLPPPAAHSPPRLALFCTLLI